MDLLLLTGIALLLGVVLLQQVKLRKIEHARRKHTRLPK